MSDKRYEILKGGNNKYTSNNFMDCYDKLENEKHDGVWDNKYDDWAVKITIDYDDPNLVTRTEPT